MERATTQAALMNLLPSKPSPPVTTGSRALCSPAFSCPGKDRMSFLNVMCRTRRRVAVPLSEIPESPVPRGWHARFMVVDGTIKTRRRGLADRPRDHDTHINTDAANPPSGRPLLPRSIHLCIHPGEGGCRLLGTNGEVKLNFVQLCK